MPIKYHAPTQPPFPPNWNTCASVTLKDPFSFLTPSLSLLVAKNQSLFDERPQQEFTAASETIKRQLSLLNRSLQELKQSSAPHPNSTSKTAMEHQRNVLLILQTWIAQSFKSLEQCNEQRNEVNTASLIIFIKFTYNLTYN